jgi:mannitol-specific phosphotransferase system IIBC component
MESLSVVIAEIIICLIVAWALGFLAAWLLFKGAKKEYEHELEELEENLAYSSSCNKNQAREITNQTLKIQEYEKLLMAGETKSKEERSSIIEKAPLPKKDKPRRKKVSSGQENEMLKMIEENLDTVNKNR